MIKRRRFIKTATAAAAAGFGFQVVPSRVVRAANGEVSPNEKIRIAAIGVGGRGGAVLNGMAGEDIVALCDVDDRRAAGTYERFPDAKRFKDFRVMFDEMADQFDAVMIATPDHTHAIPALRAMAEGKHVYCEKPLAHTIEEVRLLQKVASDTGVITQVGNQGHSGDAIRIFCEMIWGGAVGNVTEVHAGCDAFPKVYSQIGQHGDLLSETHEIPAELDWDLWLGPVAERAYNPAYLPFNWRGFAAFGAGCLGDWVCHVLDPIFWALDLDMPEAVTAEVTGFDPQKDAEYFPAGSRITFEFPAKGERQAMKIVWHDGDFKIPRPAELEEGRDVVGTGAVIRGDQGVIMHGSHGAGGVRIIPEARQQEFGRPEQVLERVRGGGHEGDWLSAIRESRPAGSTFAYGGALSEIGLLGIIASRFPEQRLEYDGTAARFSNHDGANAMLGKSYRAPWELKA